MTASPVTVQELLDAAEDVCDLLGHRWAQPEGGEVDRG